MESVDHIELARGYFEGITNAHNALLVHGWMLLPNTTFSSARIYVNGELAGSTAVGPREDVASAFPWIPQAVQSGFRFDLQGPAIGTLKSGWLDVIGCSPDGRPLARLSSRFRTDLDTLVPSPPPELMNRVAHTQDPHFFKIGGLKCFGDFMNAINRHCDVRAVRRLLDWGCGCGRVTVHFLREPNMPEVFGCDIDPEAVAWCATTLQPGHFRRIEPWPPTPYEDAAFDLVIAYSVFTHLSREVQQMWLAEMQRIIAPGGLFLASTHGEFAAVFAFPPPANQGKPARGVVRKLKNLLGWRQKAQEIMSDRILDATPDSTLAGIAPDGYYRSVFQTREYTLQEWSKYFEILEYRERGIGNFQDLVVMRRPT